MRNKPPVYMIAINEVSDLNSYAKEYVPPAQKSVKDHGGEYVAAGPPTQVAGNLPNGPVVIIRVGKHGGATALAQFLRISGCTQGWRAIREIQHRRCHWRKTVATHHEHRSLSSPRHAARPLRQGDRRRDFITLLGGAELPLLALLSFGHSRHHTTGVGGRADFRLNVITKLRGLAYWPPALLVKTATAPALPSKGPATRCTVTF